MAGVNVTECNCCGRNLRGGGYCKTCIPHAEDALRRVAAGEDAPTRDIYHPRKQDAAMPQTGTVAERV